MSTKLLTGKKTVCNKFSHYNYYIMFTMFILYDGAASAMTTSHLTFPCLHTNQSCCVYSSWTHQFNCHLSSSIVIFHQWFYLSDKQTDDQTITHLTTELWTKTCWVSIKFWFKVQAAHIGHLTDIFKSDSSLVRLWRIQ
jgi:hypothetical protein